MGLPAGEPERDQADRGDPRTGVGGLGRQRAERRRQRHHEVAARDGRHELHDRRSAASAATSTNDSAETRARSSTINGTHAQAVNDRWAYKLSAGGYTSGSDAAADRIIPCAIPSGKGTKYPYPPLQQTRARRSRSSTRASTTTTRTDGSCRSRAASPAPTGIMHTGIGPFDINSGSVMGYGKVDYTRKGVRAAGVFTNILNGDADQPAHDRTRRPARSIVHVQHARRSTSRSATSQTFGKHHVVSYGGNLRYNTLRPVDRARCATTAPSSASTSRTRSSCRTVPLRRGRARRPVRLPRQRRLLAARDAS